MTLPSDTLDVSRPPPAIRAYAAPFWEATREKRLVMQYDPRNGAFQFYPRPVSIRDGRRALEWREASGNGTVFSHTVVRRSPPPFKGHEPFLLAMITLEEGVNLMANVIRCAETDLRVGLPVRLAWAPLPDGYHLPVFEPA